MVCLAGDPDRVHLAPGQGRTRPGLSDSRRCGHRPGQPSPSLAERLDVAARLYQEGRVRYIILTGGVDTGNTISEAEVEARYLARQHGIPQEVMALETTSTSTAGNLRNARAILAERGWESVLLVTHGYHLHRALDLAQEEGVSAVGIAAESKVLFMPYHVVREVAALTWYAIPGVKAP
jgi:uncharacterized SAM-binding protein YcdF (DUF218 family)